MSRKMALASILVMIVVSSTVMVLKAVSSSSPSPASYTLVCKGGGSMKAEYKDDSGRWYIAITFYKASEAASVRQPDPGRGAWIDRPLDPGEPNKMIFQTGNTRPWLEIRPEATRIELFRGDKHSDVDYLVNALRNGEIFYVQAHLSPSGNTFIVDRIGP